MKAMIVTKDKTYHEDVTLINIKDNIFIHEHFDGSIEVEIHHSNNSYTRTIICKEKDIFDEKTI